MKGTSVESIVGAFQIGKNDSFALFNRQLSAAIENINVRLDEVGGTAVAAINIEPSITKEGTTFYINRDGKVYIIDSYQDKDNNYQFQVSLQWWEFK